MENRKIKIELLEKYIGQEKELLDFIKADKEVFEKILKKVQIDKHLGYHTAEFYINHDACYDLFEAVLNFLKKIHRPILRISNEGNMRRGY